MWRRKKKPMTPTVLNVEAPRARIRAERDLARRHADTNRVRALTTEWRRIREHNNIAAAFEASMKGGHR